MKTLRAKVLGGSLRNSASSLAVFYVEQVALNRHVSPQPQLLLLCRKSLVASGYPTISMLEPASLLCQRVRRAWLGHAKYRVSPSRWPDHLHDGGTV